MEELLVQGEALMNATDFSFHVYSLRYVGSDFLLNPIFLHGTSGFLHLILLFHLLGLWVFNRVRIQTAECQRLYHKNASFMYYRPTFCCCLGVSLFYLVLCFLSQFYWYRNGWSDERIVSLSDLVPRTLTWLAISIYLHARFVKSGETKYPLVLKVWWFFNFSVSCYSLLIDCVYGKNHRHLPVQFWVSDVVSAVTGSLFCYVGFLGNKIGGDTLLRESLLNGSVENGTEESNKCNGAETVTPYAKAGIFSLLTFSWMGPLIAVGNKKALDPEDIPQLASADSVRGTFPILRNKIESDTGNNGRVTALILAKALCFTVKREIVLTAFLAFIYTLASYVGPYLIDTFVQYLNGHRDFENQGYFLVSAFFIAKVVECLAQRRWFFILQKAGIRARAALVAMIYNKGLALSSQSKQSHSSGELINFMAVDAERIGDFGWYMHDPWMVLLQIALALVILYRSLGLAAVATLAATVIVMLVNLPLARLQERFQDKLMKSKDQRMKATTEILRNMRILKLQGWEMNFLSKIMELRSVETGWLRKSVYSWSMTSFLFWIAPTFVSVVTFGACILLGIPLESGKILSALATFRILQEPINNLPDTISMIAQTKVSLERIASFLQLDDLQADVVELLPRGSSHKAIEVVNCNFLWDLSSPNPTLKDINLSVSRGMRVAICGTVGAGKSSLLSCILGEVPKVSGTVKICGTKTYVPQSPWIQSGKIQENILFGREMDRERYDQVLEACALKKDLEILPFGDQTIIGERGINLSGGQKQRIQIARALYQDADIYLFDDPFSAVDAHTGTHLYKECVLGFLDSKTVIYVTHQVEFLHAADLILVMKDGQITQAGKYDDILHSGSDFIELVGAHQEALSVLDSAGAAGTGSKESIVDEQQTSVGKDEMVVQKVELRDDANSKSDDIDQLVQEEERQKGSVGFSVYWKYITTAYGGALVPFILLAHILFQLLQIGSNYWMAWATPVSEDAEPPVGSSTLLTVYAAFALGSSFCVLSRALLLATAWYKTATLLFIKMHSCIFRAPMSFFDSTPSGRILNRTSTDQSTVDLNIAREVGVVAFSAIQLLGIIVMMSLVAWQVFIIFIPVIAICVWLQRYYMPSARELARLVGVCKAPVIQHFSETISGSSIIRSFDQEFRFHDRNMKLIDGYSRPKFHSAGAMEWLCFRMDILSSIVFAFSLFFLISIPQGAIDPSVAGLAVTYGLSLNMLQTWTIWVLCDVENRIISVERLMQYSSIQSEPPLVVESNRPENHWPSNGEVQVLDLQVRYGANMPLVLRGLTCTFHGGKKTGIVGRTGSGKSTLIQTLFRIIDPAAGRILIDGVNISSIGLHDLRSRLSIIPQDPTMFDGTIRSNLDPLEEYADQQIWEALDKCQLGDEVRKKDGKLDSAVTENGENWSVGQRQLVCLGRVLLKKSKVLVLDEATASVDTATDNMIQQTLRQHFSDSTVITIAHRITSVLDSDMVLLLNQGLVEEYDSPTNLLEKESSSFAKMVAEYSQR